MPYIGNADLDRPVSFGSGLLYFSYGGGPFRLPPSRCGGVTAGRRCAFQLDITRGLTQSSAMLSCDLTADYASDEALVRAREIRTGASLTACVLTNGGSRAALACWARDRAHGSGGARSNGLGAARILAPDAR